jgi:CRP-like cAMP-binding protein
MKRAVTLAKQQKMVIRQPPNHRSVTILFPNLSSIWVFRIVMLNSMTGCCTYHWLQRGKGFLASFKKTVAAAALENATELTLQEVIDLLRTKSPQKRSEFDLQRLLEKLEPLRFFQKLPEIQKSDLRLQVVRQLGVSVWNKGKPIVKEGEIGAEFFVIVAGQASVRDKDGNIERILKEGVGFGEMALVGESLEDRLQMRTVMADAEQTVAVTLVRDDYLSLIRAYEERLLASTMAFLHSTHYFRRTSETVLTWIAQVLEPVTWQRGEKIAEQGKRPTHMVLMKSGEARLSVALKDDGLRGNPQPSKRMTIDVALIALEGEVICESALFDDSGNLGNFIATAPCEGYRIHKREARKLIRGSTLPLFRECQAQRQEFVRQRIVYCATLHPAGAGAARTAQVANGDGNRSLTTRASTDLSGAEEISRIGLGSLSTAALKRRHKLERASASLRSDLTAVRSRSSSSIRNRRRSGSSVASLSASMSMSSIAGGDASSDLSWGDIGAPLQRHKDSTRRGDSSTHAGGAGASTFGRPAEHRTQTALVRSFGSHSSHAASLFNRVDGTGAATDTYGATSLGASIIRKDRDSVTAQQRSRSTKGVHTTRKGSSRAGRSRKQAAEQSVFGSFALDAFQPPRLQRAWT